MIKQSFIQTFVNRIFPSKLRFPWNYIDSPFNSTSCTVYPAGIFPWNYIDSPFNSTLCTSCTVYTAGIFPWNYIDSPFNSTLCTSCTVYTAGIYPWNYIDSPFNSTSCTVCTAGLNNESYHLYFYSLYFKLLGMSLIVHHVQCTLNTVQCTLQG